MRQIVPGVYTFTGLLLGRVYLIDDPDGLTIVDAGIAPAAPRIIRQLAAAGHRPSDVRRILITHGHPDHVGGLPKLQALTGAPVFTSARERPIVEGKAPVERVPEDKVTGIARLMRPGSATFLPGTPVARELADGEILPEVMGGLQVCATPGHTSGHIAFWQPERRILFCGDVLLRLPRLGLPFRAFTVDMEEDKRSIRRVAELRPAVVCFGHGRPLTERAAERLRAFAASVGAS